MLIQKTSEHFLGRKLLGLHLEIKFVAFYKLDINL